MREERERGREIERKIVRYNERGRERSRTGEYEINNQRENSS